MSKRFRSWDVDQTMLLPPSVRDFVPANHTAHFVRELARKELDLREVEGTYGRKGHPAYHPRMMVALLLYAYTRGVFSSRKIARACEERMDFVAVTGMQKPDFRTISDFRKRHLKAMEGLFQQVLKLCERAGLVKLGHVALDGTKIKANASKHKAMSYKRMRGKEDELNAKVRGWLEQAEAVDAAEDEEFGADKRGDELPDWVANAQSRAAKIREAREAIEAEAREEAKAHKEAKERRKRGEKTPKQRRRKHRADGTPNPDAQRNFTDPESRIMKTREGFMQAYNAQAAVDAGSQVIVAQMLTNEGSDYGCVEPIVEQLERNLGRQTDEMSLDAGYCSNENIEKLEKQGIRGYVATGRQRHGSKSATKKKKPRPKTAIDRMRLRLQRGGYRSRYRLRKITVEPVFGQIKSAMGFTQFLLRGIEKVSGEWSLVSTAHNLRKLAAAVG